jgi:hypothetical protein
MLWLFRLVVIIDIIGPNAIQGHVRPPAVVSEFEFFA